MDMKTFLSHDEKCRFRGWGDGATVKSTHGTLAKDRIQVCFPDPTLDNSPVDPGSRNMTPSSGLYLYLYSHSHT